MHLHTSEQEALELGVGGYSCNWGIHIAGLYETPEERDRILFGYLSSGALARDLQLYCYHERTPEEFVRDFSADHPELRESLDDESVFDLRSAKELYYPHGTFSPWDMDRGLESFYAESRQSGPRNVRATAEMSWALEAIPGREHLMAYEARLNFFIPDKPWISVCLYDVTQFDGAIIMNVLRTHPWVLNRGILTENPYFQDPEEWLRDNAPEFLASYG